MKTVRIERDVDVRVGRHGVIAYRAGKTYKRVPEAHAAEILRRGAGEVVGRRQSAPAPEVEQ